MIGNDPPDDRGGNAYEENPCFAAALLLCFGAALAEDAADVQSMTDAQLLDLIHQCQSELADRATRTEEVLYENAELGVTVKMGEFSYYGTAYAGGLKLYGTLINRSDKKVSVHVEEFDIYVNNWTVGCAGNQTLAAEPGRNAKSTIFSIFDSLSEVAEVNAASDLQTVERVIIVRVDGEIIARIPQVFTEFPGIK